MRRALDAEPARQIGVLDVARIQPVIRRGVAVAHRVLWCIRMERINGWDEIVSAICSTYPEAHLDGTDVRVVLVVGGIRVPMRIRATLAYEHSVVLLIADLGSAKERDPYASLRLNAQLVSGALAEDGGVLFLRAIVGTVASEPVLGALALVAREAATVKKTLAPRAASTAMFDCFAD